MLTGYRTAWRRRTQRDKAMRIAVPLAIPVQNTVNLTLTTRAAGGFSLPAVAASGAGDSVDGP